jgi:hypothetical protein
MEERRVEGNLLVKNCVYNIYKKDGNDNVGVCLVESENNRSNRTTIKLRKLIGSDEVFLTKSEIYGKIPVNLSDEDLSGADLSGADLSGADLSDATIIDANLSDADLTGAILIGADLSYSNLSGATIFEGSLNNEQIEQLSSTGSLPNFQRRRKKPQQMIVIPENLLNPEKQNNSCPNFDNLYEFIMKQNLSGRFFFIYHGLNRIVIDAGGPRRDIFEKILPVYTKKFFKIISNNEDYVILKEDVDIDILYKETKQLILLAKASETTIFLKIDPTLLSLLESQNFKTYFTNNKRNRFSKLYVVFNQYIKFINNNNDYLLKNNNNNRSLMKTFKKQEFTNEEIKKILEQEIRFRRFAIICGFTNMKQFNKMTEFIRKFYHIPNSFINCKLKFDIETIVKIIKIFKKIKINEFEYSEESVPLERYVRLSQNEKSVLIINDSNHIIMNYPYLIPFLNFIFGPESSDDDRKLFIVYVSGSSSYTGELKILLSHLSHVEAGNIPYKSTTCEKYLELFINKTQNRRTITVGDIREQLKRDNGFGRA